ncbi:MAG: hypothetical protein U0R19_38960 [Bryobacteraceae bacterium]
MKSLLALLLVPAGTLFGQDPTELTMKKVAGISDETKAKEALQDFFAGSDAILALRKELWANNNKVNSAARTTQALARELAERADNPNQRLRAGSGRMFRETGSPNLNGGSTSVVAKTSATEFFAMALESGAVAGRTDKSTSTFQLNALPVWQFIGGPRDAFGCGGIQARSRATGVCESGPGFWLRGLTASVSLNVNSKETLAPITGTGSDATVASAFRVITNPSKLSALGLKYELFQREHDRKKQEAGLQKMRETLNSSLEKSGLLLKLESVVTLLINQEYFQKWVEESVTEAMTFRSDETKLLSHAKSRMKVLSELVLKNTSMESLLALEDDYRKFVQEIAKLEAEYLFKKSLAFDFVHSRPTDQPFLDTIRLDWNTPLGKKVDGNMTGPPASLDFNAAVTMYHEAQALRGKNVRLRNASASLALNYRMPSWGDAGSPVLTLAGYYQYMFENGLIQFNSNTFTPGASSIPLRGPALEVLNSKGSIGLGQLRLEIPLGKDSGLTFPIAVSYANRTELMKDPTRKFWQGHIGLSYDLSKLQEALLKRNQ